MEVQKLFVILLIILMIQNTGLCNDLLVNNTGFEFGDTTGWAKYGITEWSVDSSSSGYVVHSGSYSARIVDTGTGYIYQTTSVVSGRYYTVSGWVYDNTDTGAAGVAVYWRDSTGHSISSNKSALTINSVEYQYCVVPMVQCPDNAVEARVEFYFDSIVAGATFFVDDISFVTYDSDNNKQYSYNKILDVADNPFFPYEVTADLPLQCAILYNFPSDKYSVDNIKIFDVNGFLVREYNVSSPTSQGSVTWDGRDRDNNIVPVGVYIIKLSYFDESKTVRREFKTVIVGKKY